MPTSRYLIASLLTALVLAQPVAVAPVRAQEATDHVVLDVDALGVVRDPKFLLMFDEPTRWPGPIAWRYNPAGAPASFADTAAAVTRIQAGFDKWTAVCGVSYSYLGTTATAPDTRINDQPDGQNVVGWGALSGSTAGLTWSWYGVQGGVPRLIDGDIILSPTLVTTAQQLDRVAVHEWGHQIGLAHSNMDSTVMSGPDYSLYNILAALTDDDVRGCRCLYGSASGQSAGYLCTLPRAVEFGSIAPGATSAPQVLTLANDGNASITLQAVSLSSSGFAASGCAAGTVLGPGQACDLSLTFTPTVVTDYAATLSVPIAGEVQPYRVALSGSGRAPTGPAPSLGPTSATFASQAVGTTSAAKSLALTNAGGGIVTVNGLTMGGAHAGDFARAGTCSLGTSLGAGANCSITFTFTPSASGARSATLTVSTDAGAAPVATLSGTGVVPTPPALGVGQAALAFVDQLVGTQSGARTVTVTNAGGGTLTLASIALGGASAAEFTRGGTCAAGTSLAAAQSCTATVRFAPVASGVKSATLSITSNGGSATVALSGNGIAAALAPAASVAPAAIDFGTVAVGSSGSPVAATITNVGTAALVVGSASLVGGQSADYALVAACPSGTPLSPGQSCSYTVAFRPQAAGVRGATLRVAHNATGSPSSVALAGTGSTVAAAPSTVVEYYHSAYDHHFVTIAPDEIVALDTGVFKGWARTGLSFKAHATAQSGFAPICRFYLPPGYGDTHFYSASPAECDIVRVQNPAFVLESTAVMYLATPNYVTGACPSGTDPVYRAWNRRPDTNHRYTSERSVRDAMVALGYVAEGSGPDVVTFCAPR
jgi:hypothetical protein